MEKLHELAKQREALCKEIWTLKDKLSAEDYKITKCAEAQLQGKEMPYDIDELITRRNGYRSDINQKNEEQLALREQIVELMNKQDDNDKV